MTTRQIIDGRISLSLLSGIQEKDARAVLHVKGEGRSGLGIHYALTIGRENLDTCEYLVGTLIHRAVGENNIYIAVHNYGIAGSNTLCSTQGQGTILVVCRLQTCDFVRGYVER